MDKFEETVEYYTLLVKKKDRAIIVTGLIAFFIGVIAGYAWHYEATAQYREIQNNLPRYGGLGEESPHN